MTNISEIEARWKAATGGKWECKDGPDAPFDGEFRILGDFFPTHVMGQTFDDRAWIGWCGKHPNAVFAAHAKQDIPDLLAHIDEQAARIAELQAKLAATMLELDRLQDEIVEAAYLAWPDAEDVGYDAKYIIAELAAERDAAEAKLATVRRETIEECAVIADSFTCGICGMDGKASRAIRDLTPNPAQPIPEGEK